VSGFSDLTAVRLVAAGKIDGEFLASDRWQAERKRRMLVPNLDFSTS
jgi:hypothetical protein